MKRRREGMVPELDGWRVLLVFIVSWYHIWQQSWLTPSVGKYSLDYLVRSGYMPVDGTILLSGFLLFLPYARAMRENKPAPSTRGFYERRFMRIWPSYIVFTLLMLFVFAVPDGSYASTGDMCKDIMAHFTFTFNWFTSTYQGTHLGGASWTIAVEVQMYAIFPLLARVAMKKPGTVMLGMACVGAWFRMWAMWRFQEYAMVVNQMVAFMDVYALGMALSLVYVYGKARYEQMKKRRWLVHIVAVIVFALAVWGIVTMLHHQAGESGYPAIQAGQMMRRLPYTILLGMCMLSLTFAPIPVRWLFGNPVTRFLSSVSMNYYLVHHPVALMLKRLKWPWSDFYDWEWCVAHECEEYFCAPNQGEYGMLNNGLEHPWQMPYTLACFGVALLVAIVLTYAVEKPAAWGLRKLFAALDRKREQRNAAKKL